LGRRAAGGGTIVNAELLDNAPARLVAMNAERVHERRAAEKAAAWEYLTTGETEGPAPDDEPWSRAYDPVPCREALLDEPRLYDGTGIGALYGLSTETVATHYDDEGRGCVIRRSLVADLAGWTLPGSALNPKPEVS
jgi:hypothetical protein